MLSLLIVFFLIAIVVSFLCSLWEAVLLSITPSYAQIKMQEGTHIGELLQDFKENIDKPLAAILTLNTIAHTVGAIGVGNQAALIWNEANPLITNLVVPVVMTLGILVLSELIPKTLGANNWRVLAPFTANSLSLMIKLLYPFIWFSQGITGLIKKDKSEHVLTRSDFIAMAEIGEKSGVFEVHEREMIANLLKFNTVRVKDIMTPRMVVRMAVEDMTLREFFDANEGLRFSRIPVYESGNKDHVTGFILKDEVLENLIRKKHKLSLSDIRRDITVVDEHHPIPDLFQIFLGKKEHICLVTDEFGGVEGIVTMEDVIETLLGMEIVDEMDNIEDMRILARKNWEKRARALGILDNESPQNEPASQ